MTSLPPPEMIGVIGKAAGATTRGIAGCLCASDELVGKEDEAVADGFGVDEAHRLLVAGLAENAFASAEHDWEDDQPKLVDDVVLHQRLPELITGIDHDFPVQLLLQL